jgi:WD40 repeat protein
VYEYSATTLQLLHTFSASESFGLNEVVAGAADGSVYVASQQGEIFHYSASGMLLNELNVTTTSFTGHQVGAFFDSIAINDQTGQIALGSADYGRVFVTDLGLDTVSSFQATDATSNFFSGNVDVAWVPAASAVPEPPAIMMVGIAAVVLAASSRVRGAVWGR